jgi:CRISPR-associated endoribonuclease Cas6
MPEPTALLSLVLALRPVAAGQPHGAETLGRAAHAILLDAVGQHEPALAEALHAGSEARPFTVSTVQGYSFTRGFSPDRTYPLRYTALTAPVAQALLAATQAGGPLAPGAALNLDGVTLRIEAPAAGAPPNAWAAATDYETLSAPWLLGKQTPPPRLALRFASPTVFKSGGQHVPVPLPELVFGSLLDRWNAFAPVALPAEVRRFAQECLALSRYQLRTQMTPLKAGGLRVGAVGAAQYTATHFDRYWMSLLGLLADFALFAGVGAQTTLGLGQCRRVEGM